MFYPHIGYKDSHFVRITGHPHLLHVNLLPFYLMHVNINFYTLVLSFYVIFIPILQGEKVTEFIFFISESQQIVLRIFMITIMFLMLFNV